MRLHLLSSFVLFASFLLVMTSCQKDQTLDSSISGDDQINALVDQSWDKMASEDLFPENPSLGIEMLNEGISSDFLLEDSHLDDAPPPGSGDPATWYAIRNHSLIQCLRGLQLSEEQISIARMGLRSYEACKKDAVQRARSIYRELRATYHQRFLRLINAYRNGTLTKSEFKDRVHELRADFRTELLQLHLNERLDQAFKQCLREFMRELHGTLTERQWNSFVECYREI